jgi:hypothetical protein
MGRILLVYRSLMRPEVMELADYVFDKEEVEGVQKIINHYLSKATREHVIFTLKMIVPTRPKRPLYYINYELKFLSQNSRWIVENIGSYLDLLVKELRLEVEGSYRNLPLGANISSLLKQDINEELRNALNLISNFNKVAYVPSKHIYGLPNSDHHYFSIADTIFLVLCAVKLGELLKNNSQFVRQLAQDLCLPGQRPYDGKPREPDGHGTPFNFKDKLFFAIDSWMK